MKIDEINLWEAFFYTANERSFINASRILKINPPLLSKRVAKLEKHLGVTLFRRSTRSVALTDEGQSLFPSVAAVIDDLRALESRFENKSKLEGTIRLSCFSAFVYSQLSQHIVAFSKLHPDIKFEVHLDDGLINLTQSNIDLAIRVQEPSGADLVFKKIIENRLVLCASPKYIKKHGIVQKISDLVYHPILMLDVYKNCRFTDTDFSLKSITKIRPVWTQNGTLLTELTLQGLGIGVRSEWDVQQYFENGKLIRVLPKFPLDSFGTVYAVIPNKRFLTARVRQFVDYITKVIPIKNNSTKN